MADASRPGSDRYLVTARKYRPQTFADLVSQEHVAETLQNALLHDRLAHAYLFSGPRGVGKTTAARLLAKAINCETPLDARDGAEPCRACARCQDFEQGRSLDVTEIDAASNNGVDDIRDLQERLRIPPQGANRKVYIVDEVHMLSKPAFNALLKTLEEPPPHVLFIFATTEPHKVLPTILSRCQRFDFRRITVPQTVDRLREICVAESIDADDASLHLVARKGDGALRDALSIFDQAVSLCGTTLRYPELAEALGVVETDLFFDVTDRAQAGDRAGLLRLVDTLVGRGYDLQEFLAGLAEHLRGLYVAVSTGAADLIEADAATRERYLAAARDLTEPDLLRALLVTDEAEREIKTSPQPRLKLELALLKLASLERIADLRVLIQKLERLEGMIERGEVAVAAPAPAAPAAPTQSAEPEPPPYAPQAPPAEQPTASEPAPEPPAEAATTALPPEPEGAFPPTPDQGPAEDASPSGPSLGEGEAAAQEKTEPAAPEPAIPPSHDEPPAAPPEPAAASPAMPGLGLFGPPALQRTKPSGDGPSNALGDGAEGQAEAVGVTVVDEHFGVSLQRVRDVWPRLIATVKEERPSVAGVLAHVEPVGVEYGTVQVAVPSTFVQRLLQSETGTFAEALAGAMGDEPPALAFVVQAEDETAAPADPFECIKQLRHENPVVRALFEQFGCEIVWT
ncbi:MAG: DNA polymerase III subunit gamma/tau [Bacteroidota bacterium]